MSITAANPNLAFMHLEQIGRAMLLAFFCDIPIAIWGGPGIGKSSKVYQITAKLRCPAASATQKEGDPYRMYDLRLSDKEKSDIGGIPFPVNVVTVTATDVKATGGSTIHEQAKMYVEYLIARGLLPFDTDEYCILFIDEVDRTDDPGVKNAIQQVILDRRVNGHILSPNCRIVLAGNGTSDIDTSPLSKAANGRMIHTYAENESLGALESWQEWAAGMVPVDPSEPDGEQWSRASDLLRAFAKSDTKTWQNGQGHEQTMLAEQAEPTNRTWVYADTIIRNSERVSFKTADILKPLLAGCVGLKAATELIAYRTVFENTPSIESILADPEKVEVPTRPDILYMLTFSLTEQATRDRHTAEAVATYGLRWGEEPAAFLFRRLIEKQPSVATTPPYMKWATKRMKHTPSTSYPAYINHLPELVTIFTDGTPRPENDQWINRIELPSKSRPGVGYILAQNRAGLYWTCACPGWINHRKCDHVKRLPSHMVVAEAPQKIAK